MAWSHDARLLAVAAGDGAVRVVLHPAHGVAVPLAVVSSREQTDDDDGDNDDGGGGAPDPAVLFNPLAALFFALGSPDYELVLVGFNGEIRCFVFDHGAVASLRAEAGPVSASTHAAFWRQAPLRVSPSGRVLDCRQDLPNAVRLRRAFVFGPYSKLISHAQPLKNGAIVVSGLRNDLSNFIAILAPVEDDDSLQIVSSSQGDMVGTKLPDASSTIAQYLSPRQFSWIETVVDLIADISAHAFESSKEKILKVHREIIFDASISPVSNSRMLSVNMKNDLVVWDINVLSSPAFVFSRTDLAAYRQSLPPITDMDTDPNSVKDPSPLIAAKWWTETSCVLLFEDGFLCIASLPLKSTTPPQSMSFYSSPSFDVIPGQQVFVLETAQNQAEAKREEQGSFLTMISTPPTQSMAGLRRTIANGAASDADDNSCLTTLMDVDAADAVRLRVALGDVDGAFAACAELGVSRDVVYKQLICGSDGAAAAPVGATLDRVEDDWFVCEVACLERDIGSVYWTARSVREALRCVVARSAAIDLAKVEADIEKALLDDTAVDKDDAHDTQKQGKMSAVDLCLYRMKAFRYLDRLDTLEAINELGLSPVGDVPVNDSKREESVFIQLFSLFKDIDLVFVACLHAARGNLGVLEILFTRHGDDLLPHRFTILSNLPLSLRLDGKDGESLRKLVPKYHQQTRAEVGWAQRRWRKADWTETSETIREFVAELAAEDEAPMFPKLRSNAAVFPAPMDVIGQWYKSRALQIEEVLGDTALALSWLEFATGPQGNVNGVDDVIDELTTLFDLAQDGGASGKVTLAQLREMPADDVIRLMLDGVKNHPDLFCKRTKASVVPFLKRCAPAASAQTSPHDLLDLYLLELAPKNIQTVAKLFELSRFGIPVQDRIIVFTESRLARLILDCAYSMDTEHGSLECLHNMLRSIPSLSSAAEPSVDTEGWDDDPLTEIDANDVSQLQSRISLFENHLETIELLQRHGISVSLQYLNSQEFIEQSSKRLLAVKLARSLVQSDENASPTDDEAWLSLASDLQYLLKLDLFSSVDGANVAKEFMKGILHEGRFSLAKKLMTASNPVVDAKTSEELSVECARELFDNSDSGDMHRGFLKRAADCLRIVPPTPEISAELALIEATHQIYRLCSSLQITPPLPLEIRQNRNRLDIVSSIVYSTKSPKSLEMRILLDVGRKLHGLDGLSAEQRKVDMSVRAIVANWALDCHDIKYSIKVCEDMIASVSDFSRMNASQKSTADPIILKRSDEAWLICVRLVERSETGFSDYKFEEAFQQKLLGFLLEKSEPGGMAEVLELARRSFIAKSLGNSGTLASSNYAACLNSVSEMIADIPEAGQDLRGGIRSEGVLAKHSFHASDVEQIGSTGPYLLGSTEKSSEKRRLIELCLNLKFVASCRGVFERRQEQGVQRDVGVSNDTLLVMLAGEHYKAGESDACIAILLNVEDVSFMASVKSFFDSLLPCRMNDLLAVYFFSLRCLSSLVPSSKRADALSRMLDTQAIHLFEYVDSPPIRKAIFACGESSEPCIALKNCLFYSSRTQSTRNEKIYRDVINAASCDDILFMSDKNYQKQVVLSIARRPNEFGLLNDVLSLSDLFGINPSTLAYTHIEWLFCSPNASVESLHHGLREFGGLVAEEDVRDLTSVKADVVEAENTAKLTVYYSYLAYRLSMDEDVSQQLKARADLLQHISSSKLLASLYSVTLDEIIDSNYSNTGDLIRFYEDLLSCQKTVQGLVSLVDVLEKMRQLRFLDIFKDEIELLERKTFNTLGNLALIAALTDYFVDKKLENVEFENEEMDKIFEDYKEMHVLAQWVRHDRILGIAELYLIGDEGSFVPVELRKGLCAKFLGRIDTSSDTRQELERMMNHLQMIEEMSELQDVYSSADGRGSESLPFERVQQFDCAFGDESECVTLCMKMAIAGTSPFLLAETCKLVSKFFGGSKLFDLFELYQNSVLVIIGLPTSASDGSTSENHLRAFRRNIERDADALDRVIGVVARYNYQIHDTNFEGDDWRRNEDFANVFSNVKARVEDLLAKIVEEGKGSVSPELRLHIIGLLKTYFGHENVSENQIQLAKVDLVVRDLWNVEVSDADASDSTLFVELFYKLAGMSSTEAQSDGLKALISSLSPGFLEQSSLARCNSELAIVAAKTNNFKLLMDIRISADSFGGNPFENDVCNLNEEVLLNILRQNGDKRREMEWMKHSLMSNNAQRSSEACVTLLKLASANDSLLKDRELLLLAAANNLSCQLSKLPVWLDVVATVTSPPLRANNVGEAAYLGKYQEKLMNRMVIELILDSQYTRAFEIVAAGFRISPTLLCGIGVRYGLLKGYLRRIASSGEYAAVGMPRENGVQAEDEELQRGRKFMAAVVKLAESRSRMRRTTGLNEDADDWDEGETVLQALAQLDRGHGR
ncbi:hypothetical protein HDU84_001515 [Entophlyctis sp. JEL0112]|nr:hypothetical protein HDU84_001515 [Entophlyctis sp. JEL0112]